MVRTLPCVHAIRSPRGGCPLYIMDGADRGGWLAGDVRGRRAGTGEPEPVRTRRHGQSSSDFSGGQRLADLGDEPLLDLGGFLRTGRQDTASLRDLLKIGFHVQAGDVGRQGLQ